jgi:hypothetical protein
VKSTARLMVAGVLSVLILVSIAALASAGTSSSSSAAQYQYGKKVTVCHNGHTISISVHAWPAHQRLGDTQGPCAQGKTNHGKKKGQAKHESTPTTTTASSTPPSHGNGNGNSGGNGNGHGKK